MIPECDKTTSGVMRTSAILIASGNRKPEIFRSLDDLPGPMRQLLATATEGENSGTIWIADQRGREELGRASGPSDKAETSRSSLAIVWLWMVIILVAGLSIALLRSHL